MKISFGKNFTLAAALFVAVAAILAFNIPSINSAFKNAAYSALNPVQKNLWLASVGTRDFFVSLGKAGSLGDENRRLKEQIGAAQAQIAAAQNIKKENEFLRQALNLGLEKDFDLKLAQIAGKSVDGDILIINKGSKDMVQAGMAVITARKGLAGKIAKTYDNFSEVAMITSEGFSFDVKIAGEVDGLLKGLGGGEAAIDLISKDAELKVGDSITAGSLGGIFPEGLLIGTVKAIHESDAKTFQSVEISPAFETAEARQVFVAAGKDPMASQIGSVFLNSH